jgi:glycosyltransferase involved in cell wall biosynthesis
VVTLGRDDWPSIEESDGVLIHRFSSTRLNRLTGLEVTLSMQAFRGMRSVLGQFAPDVVNAHHLYFTTTPPALKAAQDLRMPVALTLHVAGMESFSGWRGAAARLYERSVTRRLIMRPDFLIAVSEAVADSVRDYATAPIMVIPNGVDLDRFRPRPRVAGRRRRLVFVGRLIVNKGPDVALEAFLRIERAFPDVVLTVVGDGPMRSRLEQIAKEKGVGARVEFLGSRTDVAEILADGDLFVRPSLVEGMPLTVLEAMATGLAVVACDVGGVRELVSDGATGYLVPPGSPDAVASALTRLLSEDELRLEMGAAALERVRDEFNWDKTTDLTESLLLRLSESKHD